MSIVISVTDTTVTHRAPATFQRAATTGVVKFYIQRANGTTRRVQYLAVGTEARVEAEAIQAEREAGSTIRAIAASRFVSVAHVRRTLNALALAQIAESLTRKGIKEALEAGISLRKVEAIAEGTEEAPAPADTTEA